MKSPPRDQGPCVTSFDAMKGLWWSSPLLGPQLLMSELISYNNQFT